MKVDIRTETVEEQPELKCISLDEDFVQSSSMWNMRPQMKYAVVMAVAGGASIRSPSSNTDVWDSMLSRNIELYNFGDGIHTKVQP